MRAFLAIDFDVVTKNEIFELQQRLRKYAVKGRWKHIDNFHLTLKFLGLINQEQKYNINKVMQELCSKKQPFSLDASGLGIFKGKDSVRVLWMGLSGEIQKLQLLHEDIDKELSLIGFQTEKRKFKPHITLGQDIVFERDFNSIKDIIGESNLNIGKIESVFLFKSEQIRQKRVYTKISEYKLSD